MLLTAHIFAVAAFAGRFPNPFIALLTGFMIGILIDLIPHRDLRHKELAPWVKNVNKSNRLKLIIVVVDIIAAIIATIFLVATAHDFVAINFFLPAMKTNVFLAIVGAMILPLLDLPYRVFGFEPISKNVFEFKKRMSLHDNGWSGYLVHFAIIVLSYILITQIVQTPFGPI